MLVQEEAAIYSKYDSQIRDNISIVFNARKGLSAQAYYDIILLSGFKKEQIAQLFNTSAKTTLAARAEYYSDKNGVIISSGTPIGFRTWGFSVNFDCNITPNATWRIEARTFSSKDRIFVKDNAQAVAHNTFFSTALAVSF